MGMLSDTQIKAAKAKEAEYFLRDGDGLYLRIRNNGKSWLYRYQINGKPAKLGLGTYPAVSLASARQQAREASESRAKGIRHAASKLSSCELPNSIPLSAWLARGMRSRGKIGNGQQVTPVK